MKPGVLRIPGFPETQSRLLDYLRSGRVHHALLLSGEDRDLTFRIAKAMAQAFLCRNPRPGVGFCGECLSCRKTERNLHPDLLVYGRDTEDTIKIDAVRELCREMEIGPTEGGAKIAIVDEAQRMSPGAANAFLKTLEEPMEGRHFWLTTTNPSALLPTTRSRCVEFLFKPEGGGRAPVGVPFERERLLFDEAVRRRDTRELLAAVDKDKERCLELVRYLQTVLRDSAVGGDGIAPLKRFSRFDLLRKFDEAVQLEGRLRSHANHGLMLELFVRREFLEGA